MRVERLISGTIAARGLKFWLQVGLGPQSQPDGLFPDIQIQIREIRIFRKSGKIFFWLLWTPYDLLVNTQWK